MKRSGFKRSAFERPSRAPVTPASGSARCRMSDPRARLEVPIAKEGAIQHEGYMNLVRSMKCAHCGRPPRSQFCHADEGKGAGIKTDCRRGWPGCGDDIGANQQGCHSLLGSTGKFLKEMRRTLEENYAAQTRATIMAAGKWPKNLPLWEPQEKEAC